MAAARRAKGAAGARARHTVAVGLALAAGAALVTLVFAEPAWDGGPALRPRFDLGAFARRLPEHASWLVPFVLLAACLPGLRALVWRAVLPRPPPRLADAYHATALGALVHNALPGKLGPVAAAWVLARHADRPFTPTLSSQLVGKLLEMGVVVILGTFAAAALALGAPRAAGRLRRRFPRAGAVVAAVGEGVAGAGSVRRLAVAAGLAALPALTAVLAYGLALRGVGVEGSAAGGAVLVAVLTFGQFTPGLPIGTGVYWSLAAWAARGLGASAADAAAVAVLSHAGMVAANLLVGGASALARRGDLAELFRRRREVGAPGAAPPAEPSPRAPT